MPMSKDQAKGKAAVYDYQGAIVVLTSFLQSVPLYVKLRTNLAFGLESVRPETLELNCPRCKAERPFRGTRRQPIRPGDYIPQSQARDSGIRKLEYTCTGCEQEHIQYWIQVQYGN